MKAEIMGCAKHQLVNCHECMAPEYRQLRDGGSAFPVTHMVDLPRPMADLVIKGGMSLRDWFAGKFAPGILRIMGEAKNEDIARQCYSLADAMLAERKKEK
jgi:hypothetical protein